MKGGDLAVYGVSGKKRMIKKIVMSLFLALLFPTVATLAWTGSVGGKERQESSGETKRIVLDGGTQLSSVSVEEYLWGIVAEQIPADYGKEALKAQAMVARTYIYGIMDGADEIPESSLDLDYPSEKSLEEQWGKVNAAEYFQNIKTAVEETEGQVIVYDGKLITPLFHRASTGRTRDKSGELPYIKSVESPQDVEADGFLQMVVFSPAEFAARIREIPDGGEIGEENLFAQIQTVSVDGQGYVEEIQIGTASYSGEEVEYALGLASPAFTLEDYGGNVRAVVKGIGHGCGLSQYGARKRAEEGWTAEEIIEYFYPGAEVADGEE